MGFNSKYTGTQVETILDALQGISYDQVTHSFVFEGNIIVTGGAAFRAVLGDLNIPTIMDYIIVDEQTIIKDNSSGQPILKLNPNLDLGGLDTEELQKYLDDNKYVTVDKINDFKFIDEDTLKKYFNSNAVTLDTYQEITEEKNFKKGIKLNDSPIISYDKNTKSFLFDGNIIVSGGAVFRTSLDNLDTPDVWSLIPFDDTMSWDGSKWSVVKSGGGGSAEVTYDSVISALGYTPLSTGGGVINGNLRVNKYLSVGAGIGQANVTRAQLDVISADANPSDITMGADNQRYWDLTARNANGGVGKAFGIYNYTTAAYAVFVTETNNVAIGGDVTPTERLRVTATSGWCTSFKNTNSAVSASHADGYGMIITSTMPTTSSGYLFRVWQGSLSGASGTGTAIFDVMANNSVIARANLLATGGITAHYTSDERLKTNLRPINAGKMILSLGRVREFEYIDSEIERNSLYKGRHIGLIYQDVKDSALSKMCFEREDGYGSLNYLDTSLTSLLVGVAQEHEIRLTEDEREIQNIKNENMKLREEIAQLKRQLYG